MYNFGQILKENKGTIKQNPVTRGYSIILWDDQFEESFEDFNLIYSLNNKEFPLSKNRFNNNIYNVLLDANISKEDIEVGIIEFKVK